MSTPEDRSFREKFGLEALQKFEFYFVGLTFAILALSIQSAKPHGGWIDAAEVGAWFALLHSGLIGLVRLRGEAWRHIRLGNIERLHGVELVPEESVALQAMNDEVRKLREQLDFGYRVQMLLFLVGVGDLGFARAAGMLAFPAA